MPLIDPMNGWRLVWRIIGLWAAGDFTTGLGLAFWLSENWTIFTWWRLP